MTNTLNNRNLRFFNKILNLKNTIIIKKDNNEISKPNKVSILFNILGVLCITCLYAFFPNQVFGEETLQEASSAGEKIADYYIKNAEKDSWKLAIPRAKGGAYEAFGHLDSYLQWLNGHTGKNFSQERDLEIQKTELAQNINRVGETAFCIQQLIKFNKDFLKENDKWYLLDSTLSWSEWLQQIMPLTIKSEPVFFINGREKKLKCSDAINHLLFFWDIEINEHKKADFYKTLATIYGDKEAEFILRQLLLTNANYNYMRGELHDLISDFKKNSTITEKNDKVGYYVKQ